MVKLADVLGVAESQIVHTFGEALKRAGCATFAQLHAAEGRLILQTLRACCDGGDKTAARDWAKAVADADVPRSEVIDGLVCLERVVRFHLVKSAENKQQLLAVMTELDDAVDLLRQCCLETPSTESPGGERPVIDFTSFADSADVFICLASLHGKPFYLNRAGRRLIGLGSDDISATSLYDYYSQESWDELRDVTVPAVKDTGHWEGRSRLCNAATGELLDVLTTVFLVKHARSEKPACLAIVHRRSGRWLEVEEALAESQARKHAILESSLDPIITIDHRGVITEFNRAAEQTFRHAREKVLGTQPSEVLFPASRSAGHQNRIDRYLDAGEGSLLGRRIEVVAVRANGETFPAEMAMTISQEQGAPVLSFFVRDIGQRKKAEREQARYAAELERSNSELEQFAYVASHDLQEPLRKIRTFSDRLEMKCGDLLNDTGRECIQRMQSAAGRMQLLIEGLLTLSRVATREKDFVPVDLAQVAREVVCDLEVQIEQAEGRVEVGSLPTIQADPLQMRQLLQNLVGNALKFRRVDEPPLVKIRGRFVEPRGHRHGGPAADELCRILVEDNGIGFDEKYLDRVFGVFQRLHPRDVYEGTGIGLPICRKIVERHGGTVTARSTPGKGTTFEVLLPVIQAKNEQM